jgi:PAS domain S-box-containing protein
MMEPSDKSLPLTFLVGGGEMGALMRARDWSQTPLGPPSAWPQSLRTSVSTCLNCAFPILLWWGPELVLLYNDEYAPILGEKHPRALGQPGSVCWAEIWDVIGPMLRQVMGGGEPTRSRDLLLVPLRQGFLEESYFSFSYSPIRDESGGIGGVFTPVIETTAKVIGERRLRTLRDLGTASVATLDVASTLLRAATALAGNPHDMPFAALYHATLGPARLTLAGSAGLQTPCSLFPNDLPLDHPDPAFPFHEAARDAVAGKTCILDAPPGAFADTPLPANPWPEPPKRLAFLPVIPAGQERAAAILVCGLSPRLALDDAYCEFLDLASSQIGAALADALAYEEERRRAEALARLDQAKSAFFANVSHEFRTPLTLMLGPLEELLADPNSEAGVRQRAEEAHRSAVRLLRLVNDLLDFSRLEAGRAQAHRVPADLSALTADLASQFRSLCESAGLYLKTDCPALPAPVPLDPAMWEKIVFNLLSNAFKFTHEGGITVSTGLSPDGRFAELRVADTGIGIPQSELPRLFDRFHRVAGAMGRSHEGAGIGLALVREMALLHGGDVLVESQGHGTTFTVRIGMDGADQDAPVAATDPRPVLASAYVGEAARWLPASSGEAAPIDPVAPAHAPRILVADDNADMRAYVCRLLGSTYRVEAVEDGARAFARATDSRPDLILSDVMMPGMDGLALVRALRADPRTRQVPVILLSARAGSEAGSEGLSAGADDYLVKPFAELELRARVAAALRAAQMREATTRRERDLLAQAEQANARLTEALAELEARESELRRLNASLESMVDDRTAERDRIWRISHEMLVVVASDGILRAVNPAWTRNLGYAESELVGRHLSAFEHPDDLALSLVRISRTEDGPLTPTENRYRHKDGSWRWISWTAVAERGLFYAVGRDVTAERRQAEALAKAEDALRQAQKMEAVGQLTGGIAHDFNNLLQSISSGVELMRRRIADGRPQDAARFVEAAQKAIERAAALTYRLLAFSRRQALSPKRVEVDELLHGLCDLIRQTVGPSVEVRVRLLERCWPVRCDPNQLENAILNLAINARDAMPEGGAFTVESKHAVLTESDLAGASAARPGEFVLISARDTGAGMPPDVLARAFEPFFTTKPAGHGTGLGLSQVYGFVSQSSGLVRLESTPGKGTSVHMYLPRDLDSGVDDSDTAALLAAAPPRAVSGATVLLVEDEADLRAHGAEALRDIGCRVIEAGDGSSALNALRDALRHDGGGIDMLVSDIGLPGGLNGHQLADAARDMLPDLPILLVTGYTAAMDSPGLPSGMAYLPKPFTLEALTTRVRAMLQP